MSNMGKIGRFFVKIQKRFFKKHIDFKYEKLKMNKEEI